MKTYTIEVYKVVEIIATSEKQAIKTIVDTNDSIAVEDCTALEN